VRASVAVGLAVAAAGLVASGVGGALGTGVPVGFGLGVAAGGVGSAWLAGGLDGLAAAGGRVGRRSFGVSFGSRAVLLALALIWAHRMLAGPLPSVAVVAGYFLGEAPLLALHLRRLGTPRTKE
jgi:hypothetical protein